ncbi:rRNA maturation RNase YbeY [Acidobacteriota bacterium]
MLDILGITGELNILFTDNRTIRKLNHDYRGLDQPTDVLSFEAGPVPGGPRLIGDIVISGQTAEKNAGRYKKKYEDELLKLIAHGILHLLKYDHKDMDKTMNRLERRLLEGISHYPERGSTEA